MRKGLALVTLLLLTAASWLPLVTAQEGSDHGFDGDLGDELQAFGRGYVENLVLYSGAGVGLAWGPSFGGNATAMADRLSELETAVNGSMPANTSPIVIPFRSADPGFAGPAPLDHAAAWAWNTTGIEATATLGSIAAVIQAETELAMLLLEGEHGGMPGTDNDTAAEGLLMLTAAIEAVRFVNQNMGYNGSAEVPLNMSEPNMTDGNFSNGYWLPASWASGVFNPAKNGSWDAIYYEMGNTLDSCLLLLRSVLKLSDYLSDNTALVGAGKAFPEGTDRELQAISKVLFNNIRAVYYDADADLFYTAFDGFVGTETLALLFEVLMEYSGRNAGDGDMYWPGWTAHHAERVAGLLLQLQRDDGTMSKGLGTNIGGVGFIPPFEVSPEAAGLGANVLGAEALYDAADRFDSPAYALAAEACLAAVDSAHWHGGLHVIVADNTAADPMVELGVQVKAMSLYAGAVEDGDVELARYRIPDLWRGMVSAGLQMSETDATGENYTAEGNDTDMDGIPKHNMSWGAGRDHGVAPVLASASSFDGDANWTLEDNGTVDAWALMDAALLFLGLDAAWFTDMGEPAYGEEYATMLLLWSDDELVAWMDARKAEIAALNDQVATLQDALNNTSGNVTELLDEIESLRENLTAMQLDLNDSMENETVLRNQTKWLRERLEETNGTVDNLTKEIEVLESKVARLEKDLGERDENVTKLEVDLRAARFNATQLLWDMDNASAALTQAELDLEAAERDRDDTQADLEDAESRLFLTALIALIAGMIVVVVILRIMGKL